MATQSLVRCTCGWVGDDTLVDWSTGQCPRCCADLTVASTSNNGQMLLPKDALMSSTPEIPVFGIEIHAHDLTLPEVKRLLETLTQQLQTHHELYLDATRQSDEIDRTYQQYRTPIVLQVGEEEAAKAGMSSSKPGRALSSTERDARVDLLVEEAIRQDMDDEGLAILDQRRRAEARRSQLELTLKHLKTQASILGDIAMTELGIRKHTTLDGTP